jgi:2-oxoisovalerate dehydrogenase E1 component alpha subunit
VAARKIAVEEQQPVLIETMSYRLGAHSTSDDPSGYRSREEEQQWRENDPISRMKNWLLKQNYWDEERDEALKSGYRSEILTELKLAEKRLKPALEDLITDVYQTPPQQLREQFQAVESHMATYPQVYPNNGLYKTPADQQSPEDAK